MHRQHSQQLRTLHEISLIALNSQSLGIIAQRIIDKICSAMGFPIGAIELYDPSRQVMIFIGVKGIPVSDTEALEVPVEQTLSGSVAQTGELIIKQYAQNETKTCQNNSTLNQLTINTFICQPMKINQQVIGVLSLAHSETIETDESFLEWLSILANFVASLVERKRAETALTKSEERFHKAFMNAPFPVIIYADDGEVLQINHAWTNLTGYFQEEISTIAQLKKKMFEEYQEVKLSSRERLDKINHQLDEGEFTIRIRNGELKTWQFNLANLGLLSDGRQLMISMANDVTEQKQAEARLRYDALHDGLTGLPNRLLLMDRLEQASEQAQQNKNYRFALLFIDLDRFKVVNDSLGHFIGDQLLVAISSLLQQYVRATDTVARLGGDEFIILLNGLKEEKEAIKVAQRINEELKTPFIIEGRSVFTTASIGIAFNSSLNERGTELLRNADLAMYDAKERGKSCYAIFDPIMHSQAHTLLELETNLRLALERQEFRVYYQPIVCLATGELVGFEALARWQHPEKGLIAPATFIPIAEETGLILSLGKWILFESCRQMAAWQQQYSQAALLKISVNLSVKQLQQGDLVEEIAQILEQTGLKGESLKLEITESSLMDNPVAIIDIFERLKSLKIEISIDDFGTGYSCLNYLHYLPLNTLKIDRSFISIISHNCKNIKIVETILTLAHHLKFDVVAEGIETKEHLAQLQVLGCELGQGYLFSKPLDSQGTEYLLQLNKFN